MAQNGHHHTGTATLSIEELELTVKTWLECGQLAQWSNRTLTDRRWWMDRLLAFLSNQALSFSVDGLRQFFLTIQRGEDAFARKPLKPASLKHAHTIITAFGNWCIEEGLLSKNPMKRVPSPVFVPERIEPFTDEELNRIFSAAGQSFNRERDVALLCLLIDTGLRASELAAVKLDNIDPKAKTIRVVSGKGGKSRVVAYGSATAESLNTYLVYQDLSPQDFLFQSERGGPLTRDALLRICRRIGQAAGVRNVHTHRFRHDCAIRLLRRGAQVFGVMAQLGHAKVQTTCIYVRVAEQDVRSMLEKASPVDGLTNGN